MSGRTRGGAILLAAAVCLAAGANAVAQKKLPKAPPINKHYDIKRLGLGQKATIVIAMESDCKPCLDAVGFYKSLMKLPQMDGSIRRVVVVAMDGVWPVKDQTDARGFAPHRLTSGPYPIEHLPGVKRAPTVLVLDGSGRQRGIWEGALSAEQQKAIVAAASAK